MSKRQREKRISLDTLLKDEDLTGQAPNFFHGCHMMLCEARLHGHPLADEAGNILSGILHFPFPDDPTALEVLPATEAGRLLRLHAGVGGQSAADLVEDQSLEHDFWHVHLLKEGIFVTAFTGQRVVWFNVIGYDDSRRVTTPASYVSSGLAWGQKRAVARATARSSVRGPGFSGMLEGTQGATQRKAPRSQAPTWLRDLTVGSEASLGPVFISFSLPDAARGAASPSRPSVSAEGLRTVVCALASATSLLQ